MKISRTGHCGNSSKNRLIENIAISLAERDLQVLEEVLTDDFRWAEAGVDVFRDRDAFLRDLADESAVDAITIFHVSSHGRVGAVNGEVALPSSDIAFCHVIEFGNAKGNTIKTITSYSIAVGDR